MSSVRRLFAGCVAIALGFVLVSNLFPGGGPNRAQAAGNWTATSDLQTARISPSIISLLNHKVLISGGTTTSGAAIASAELYDPSTGSTAATGSLITPRTLQTSTRLPTGKVLRAGGLSAGGAALDSVELYDPAAATWTATGSLNKARFDADLYTPGDGRVYLVGGQTITSTAPFTLPVGSVERYDPNTGVWTLLSSMATPRISPSAVTIPVNGKFLVYGGFPAISSTLPLASAELFDPIAGTWSPTGSLNTARERESFIALPTNGKILVAGGRISTTVASMLASAELYDPITGTWAATGSMTTGRQLHAVSFLTRNGKVLAAGGRSGSGLASTLSSAELYNPVTGTWAATDSMSVRRFSATLDPLEADGLRLAFGGFDQTNGPIGSSELYDPDKASWTLITGQAVRSGTARALLNDGRILRVGGRDAGGNALATTEVYKEDPPAGPSWTVSGNLATERSLFGIQDLNNGNVLVIAGLGATGPLKSAEVYNEVTGTFTGTGALATARVNLRSVRLSNGRVLATGGSTVSDTLSAATFVSATELYDPITGGWTAGPSMKQARSGHSISVVGLTGQGLFAGGTGGAAPSAELFNQVTGTFTPTVGAMVNPNRSFHSATTLFGGRVLIAGGVNAGVPTAGAEIYDPATGTFAATGSMATARGYHGSTRLDSGKVIVIGGFAADGTALSSTEIFDPIAGTWSAGPTLSTARGRSNGFSLPDGTFLVGGGLSSLVNGTALQSTEILNQTTLAWSVGPALVAARGAGNGLALPDGRFLIIGGQGSGGTPQASTEIFPGLRQALLPNIQVNYGP